MTRGSVRTASVMRRRSCQRTVPDEQGGANVVAAAEHPADSRGARD